MALSLEIAGVDRTAWLAVGSCAVSRPLGGRASCSAVLEDRGRGFTPVLNSTFIVKNGATIYFGGTIRSISVKCHPDGAYLKKQFSIRALDYNHIPDRRRTSAYIYRATAGWTLAGIVTDILERHLDGEGITAPGLTAGPTLLEDVSLNFNSVTEAFNNLSNLTASYGEPYLWNIDFSKVLNFSQYTSNPAPFSLTDTSNNFWDFELETTLDSYTNVQHVRTEYELTGNLTQEFTGNGVQTTFHLFHAVREAPVVRVNGVIKTVGRQDVDETGKDFKWVLDEDGIYNQDHAVLSAMDTLSVTFAPSARNVATAYSAAGTAAYGQFEAVDEQRNISDFDQAIARAEGRLEQFDDIPVKLKFKTRTAGLEPGHRLTINLTRHGINAAYLVEDLNFSWVPARTDFLEYSVRCTSIEKASPAKTAWLEKLVEIARIGSPPAVTAATGKSLQRTLLLKNTAIGDDIADHVTIYADGTAVRMTGTLRVPITDDLVVRLNLNGTPIMTLTIPDSTGVDTPVESTTFADDPQVVEDGDVLSWDVTGSDEQIVAAGVAAFTFEWTP